MKIGSLAAMWVKEYLAKYGTYLDYIRKVQSDRIFRNFTKLALKWNEEG
jgi:hypothetical protein